MAKETNANDYDIDSGTYDFAKSNCGCCHPGGGLMEFDRNGNRLDAYLAAGNTPANLHGDYYHYDSTAGAVIQSPWQTSGVLEIDCLMCHGDGYSSFNRATQVKAGNFRAAPTAGAGLGTVVDNETVTYDANLSTNGITFHESPDDHNCCLCHVQDEVHYATNPGNARSDVKKRAFNWGPIANVPTGYVRDVHDSEGMSCTTCHTAGIDHQVAKGNDRVGTVRNDLDYTVTSCAECHVDTVDDSDELGVDPATAHAAANFGGIYSFHMDKLDCTVCHIPYKDGTGLRTIEIAGGAVPSGTFKYGLFTNGSPGNPAGWTLKNFKPTYQWWSTESGAYKLFPMNMMTEILWGEKNGHVISYSLYARDLTAAANAAGIDATWDDTSDGIPEVNTAAEITAMRDAIIARGTAVGNPNIVDPYLWVAPHVFSLSHNIRPATEALGATSCNDCHDSSAWMFDGDYMIWHYEMENSAHLASHLEIMNNDGSTSLIDIDFSLGGHNYINNWKLMGYTQAERDQLILNRTP